MDMNRLELIKGCLLGGAVGDALGAPVAAHRGQVRSAGHD